MKILKIILIPLLMLLAAPALSAAQKDSTSVKPQKTQVKLGGLMPKDSSGHHTRMLQSHLIAPKGEFQTGLQAAYASISSEDSEFMLAAKGIDASLNAFRITPFVGYTYSNNHSVGMRFAYTTMRGHLGKGTIDLLNEGLEFGGDLGLSASMWAFAAEAYHRTYIGLDNNGRVGIFWDFVLGYSLNKSRIGDSPKDYGLTHKAKLSFNPGIVVYPMNNVSFFVSISLADVSYNNARTYENFELVGVRNYWDARCKLNLFDVNLGLTFHL